MIETIGWDKILATALVTALFTTSLSEPIKAWIQGRLKRRQMRTMLYREMIQNYSELIKQVSMAEHEPEMREGIGIRFGYSYSTLAYDLAQKDAITYYSLGYGELYWMRLCYKDHDHVVKGQFQDAEQRLRNASFAASSLVSYSKNRHLSRRLFLKHSPPWLKIHLREALPNEHYIDVGGVSRTERMRRRLDSLRYWWWKRRYPTTLV